MAKASMHVSYYLLLLTFCIDEGDGRWKQTDREILHRDIHLFKKIAERVEYELKEYYDDYVDDDKQPFYANREAYKRIDENELFGINKKDEIANKRMKEKPLLTKESTTSNDIPIYNKQINNSISANEMVKNNTSKKINTDRKWPKFEDMLLAIGKKYDWKNDRWIKVKEKFKYKESSSRKPDNSIMFHEKHRFNYRSIKLNRGKNKRNIVIAVTAIR